MAISLELDTETEQRLNDLAKRTGQTPAFHLQELIAHGIEDLEDLYLAEATMQRVASGKEPVYSSAQVRKNLGLADCLHSSGATPAFKVGQGADRPTTRQLLTPPRKQVYRKT